jgi:hypothetical protein
MVVGWHPTSNPANWAPFCCQWLLRKTAKNSKLAGSLSEADGATHQKLLTPVQIRIPHLNRRPHFSTHFDLGRKNASMSTTNSFGGKPVDTKHLGQKQLRARLSTSKARLERGRSEGLGPKFLKLLGRVLYQQVDIEAFEVTCLSSSTKALAAPVSC